MDISKKSIKYLIFSVLVLAFLLSCSSHKTMNMVLTGADILLSDSLDLIQGKKIGIITNHTAVLASGSHIVDTLYSLENVEIKSLFGPEHGIRGNAPDGESIKDGIDSKTGLKVFSLYGKTRKPSSDMLGDVEILIFDIQDIGARFYTFISTMYYAIQSAAENNIEIIILDRPNPIGGLRVEGPVLIPEFQSFVGIAEIPIRHGMTVGELALFFNRAEILGTDNKADLKVVKMKHWKRKYYYDDSRLKWINPSPNMPSLETAIVYPGLCLLEATNISEGRGTLSPFLVFGSPFIKSTDLIKEISQTGIEGIELRPIEFTPVEISNMSKFPKYKNELCRGIEIQITDRDLFRPIKFGIELIHSLNKLYPENFLMKESRMTKLWGNNNLSGDIKDGKSSEQIIEEYGAELEKFIEIRDQFLLYN